MHRLSHRRPHAYRRLTTVHIVLYLQAPPFHTRILYSRTALFNRIHPNSMPPDSELGLIVLEYIEK